VWSVLGCVASCVVGVAAGPLSWVVRPLDRPCDEDEPTPLLGSDGVAGAVLWVVGVLWTLDAEPLDVPGAVLCVVGVLCGVAVGCPLGAEPFDVPDAVPCGGGGEACAGWDVVSIA
jgi:hypothetical protein